MAQNKKRRITHPDIGLFRSWALTRNIQLVQIIGARNEGIRLYIYINGRRNVNQLTVTIDQEGEIALVGYRSRFCSFSPHLIFIPAKLGL